MNLCKPLHQASFNDNLLSAGTLDGKLHFFFFLSVGEGFKNAISLNCWESRERLNLTLIEVIESRRLTTVL